MPLSNIFGGFAIWVVMVGLFFFTFYLAKKFEDDVPFPMVLAIIITIALVYLLDFILRALGFTG